MESGRFPRKRKLSVGAKATLTLQALNMDPLAVSTARFALAVSTKVTRAEENVVKMFNILRKNTIKNE